MGIGINCGQKSADFREEIADIATSLSLSTGRSVDRVAVAAALVESLARMSAQLQNPAEFLDRYRANCITLGQEISLVRGEEIRHGKALDIDDQGALLVHFSDGHTEAVNSGEVSVRGVYGYI